MDKRMEGWTDIETSFIGNCFILSEEST